MFYDPALFAFTAVLRQHWRRIADDYQTIRESLVDWYEKKLYGEGWKVFGLFDFPHGQPIEPNIRRCSFTAGLVQEHIPTHGAAGFSVLRPQTVIQAHQGYPGDFLRCHLGLRIPAGDCALKVNGETRPWEAGGVLVFDDRLPHEAWNRTDGERVIFLVDFVPVTNPPGPHP
jgi:beta-hydroxylase